MKIFNLNLKKRLTEWHNAVQNHRNLKTYVHIATHFFKLGVGQKTWRRRYRTCLKCPVFVRISKTCGNGVDQGCGCYTPFLAMTRVKRCWGKAHFGDIGWGD